MKKYILAIISISIIVLFVFFYNQKADVIEIENIPSLKVEIPENIKESKTIFEPEIVSENLSAPWEICFLPDGEILVSERSGNIKKIGEKSTDIQVSDVVSVGEGGLLGITLHPEFSKNNWIYLYLTTRNGNNFKNIVVRYILSETELREKTIIIDNIPAGSNHNGGRIAFGPDKLLYVATGDSGNPDLAQETASLAGKILRVKSDGSLPEDNPFTNPVFSYGHRNVQGITWDDKGNLWATEHGRSGIFSGYDELNLIQKGKNYGWPEIQGDETEIGMEAPIINSGSATTWAPSGAVFFEGSIFFAGLRGQTLYEYDIQKDKIIEHLKEKYGRLRNISIGNDGNFYLLTNNTDGRGSPQSGDDKIIKFPPTF